MNGYREQAIGMEGSKSASTAFFGLPGFLAVALVIAGSAVCSRAQTPVLDGERPRISGALSLAAALEMAMHSNLEVDAMQFEAEAAHQESRAMRSMRLPQISANTYFSSGDMPNILSSPPGLSPANALMVPSGKFVDQNLTLMIPLYTGGKLGNLAKAASQRESAARADVETAAADASLLVKESYYGALLAAEMVKVAQARLDAASAMLASTRAQVEAGRGIQASVARAQAEMADARRMVASAGNDRAKMLLDLKLAMGVRLDSDITLTDSLALTPPAGDLQSSLVEAARARPELAATRARLDAVKAQAGVARGAYKPQIYGAAMADAFSSQGMDDRKGGTVGVIVSFPLMDAGQRRAEARQMEAMQRRSEAELKNVELRIAAEVRKAWLDVETASANYSAAEAGVRSLESAYEVVVLRVASERAIMVEQLDALAALTQARANLEQARFDHSIAVARLLRAIGRS